MKRTLIWMLVIFCILTLSGAALAAPGEVAMPSSAPTPTPIDGTTGQPAADMNNTADNADGQSFRGTPEQCQAAYNEIHAQIGDVIRAVYQDDGIVTVAIMDGYGKQYARKYVEQYGAFVTVTEVSEPFNEQKWRESLSDTDAGAPLGVASDAGDIVSQWEQNGYPDDIGGIYYGGLNVVNPTPERIAELRALFGYDITITPCKYSYNELMRVQGEITALMGSDSKIYGVGTGWHSVDGEVTGFGESGKEFRVVVNVDESAFDRYQAEFSEKYGDMVFVEASGQPITYDAGGGTLTGGIESGIKNGGNEALWPLLVIGLVLLGALTMLVWQRTRLTPALQTANGKVVTSNKPISKAQVVAAVKDSGQEPRDTLFEEIVHKIDETERQRGK